MRTASRILFVAMPLAGFAILVFLAGIVTAIQQQPPFHSVRDALLAYHAYSSREHIVNEQWPEYMWYPADGPSGGVLQSDPDRVQGDYTLFTSTDTTSATLVDRAGTVMHQWNAPFWQVFPNSKHVPSWVSDRYIVMRRAMAYPNGDLLALYETVANTPTGCGLAKLDSHGNVLWAYDDYAHHDLDIGPDGRIYVLLHELRRLGTEQDSLGLRSDIPVVENCVAILDADGREQSRISLLEALAASPYYRPILTHVDHFGDVTHNNTVQLIGEEFAAHYPEVSAGDLMVCLRNLNLVAIVSPASGKLVWATNGPWEHPHDPDPLPNGNIMIFDNYLVQGTHHGSAVLEFDPRSRNVAWQYTGDNGRPLRSDIRGCQQLLASGNVLITECDRGRIVEVDRSGEIVWEFVHPARGGRDNQLLPLVCGARRYAADELPFLQSASAESLASSDAYSAGEPGATLTSQGKHHDVP